ncbi:hypothetical protein [Natrinema ejinorense]|uniref:Uncharacterized protein n=1 Tax=Natrinema ejinorense TaxID=373386 RepID=A0A2A5QWV6_9EURY|nr:hypothetical protein [Natrinema ejinorense]PCR91332.1 hypothetical protein CP557_12830 [Natrinema ejinorense]
MTDADASTEPDGSNATADRPPYRVALAPFFEAADSVSFDPREVEAAIAGGLAGAFPAALLIQRWDTDAIRRVGAVFGASTLDGGWLAMFTLGVLFALPFIAFVSICLDPFVEWLLGIVRHNASLRAVLVALLDRSALATITFGLGNGYGAAVGVGFGLLLQPLWVTVVLDVPTAVPILSLERVVAVVAWTVYGGTLGLVYGLLLEH